MNSINRDSINGENCLKLQNEMNIFPYVTIINSSIKRENLKIIFSLLMELNCIKIKVFKVQHSLNVPEFDKLFPTACNMALCSWLHSSNSTDLTRDTCAPRFRWIPEHSIQIKMPKFNDAQVGLGMWQSAHDLFPGRSKFNWEPSDPIERDSSDSVNDPQLIVLFYWGFIGELLGFRVIYGDYWEFMRI